MFYAEIVMKNNSKLEQFETDKLSFANAFSPKIAK